MSKGAGPLLRMSRATRCLVIIAALCSSHALVGPVRTMIGSARSLGSQARLIAPAVSTVPSGVVKVVTWPARKVREAAEFLEREMPMLRFLWPKEDLRLRAFLVLALAFMFLGKWVNIQIPFILQKAIDGVSKAKGVKTAGEVLNSASFFKGSALSFLLYGASRALSVVCSEIKTCLFAHVSQNVLRLFANDIFNHLHSLDNDFHISTPSGLVSVAYTRAVRGFQTTLFQIVFSVVPMFLELFLVAQVLHRRFGAVFSSVTVLTFSLYLAFTVWITQWRVALRKELVEVDNTRNGFFIDTILNQEVIKLFTAEQRESDRFDKYLREQERLSIQSTYAIALLNLGQALLFCGGLTVSLVLAFRRVLSGQMSVGDLVAVNSMLLQLSIPFNFIGFTYQELRQAFVDMGYMRGVLTGVRPSVVDSAASVSFNDVRPRSEGMRSSVEFRNVTLRQHNRYAESVRLMLTAAEEGIGISSSSTSASAAAAAAAAATSSSSSSHQSDGEGEYLLRDVSFSVRPGQSVALVGPSGSGKSTALRLITRMLDASSGAVLIDGVDTRHVSLQSLRSRVAVVPQDNSLFDNTIEYNIRYGRPDASDEQLRAAVRQCNLDATISKLPDGLATKVGERGQRLSGGERQKVSIARALLKDPSLILCDEVTSAVDAFAERDIVETLRTAGTWCRALSLALYTTHTHLTPSSHSSTQHNHTANKRTTVTIAHRLSSIINSDNIIVLDKGRVVQQGSHTELLRQCDGTYARMWTAQQGDAWMEGREECDLEDGGSAWDEADEYIEEGLLGLGLARGEVGMGG